MAVLKNLNFEGYTNGSPIAGFSNGWTATNYSPVSGTLALTGQYKTDGETSVYTGISAVADCIITTQQILTGRGGIGVAGRCDSSFQNGYLTVFTIGTNINTINASLFKKVNGTYSEVVSSVINIPNFYSGDIVNIKLYLQGTSIKVRYWSSRSSEPTTWQFQVTDSSVTAAGYVGFYYGLNNGASGTNYSIDNISIEDFTSAPVTQYPLPYYETFEGYSAGVNVPGFSGNSVISANNATSGNRSFTSYVKSDQDFTVFTGIVPVADMVVSGKQKANFITNTKPAIGLIFRSDATFQNGYLALCGNRTGGSNLATYYLFRKINGVYTKLTSVSGSIAPASTFYTKAQIKGSAIKVKFWDAAGSEPSAWDIQTSDNSTTAAGYFGFYYGLDGASTGTDIGIDDISVTTVPEAAITNEILASNSAFVTSKGNWNLAGSTLVAINSGAKIKTLFNGNSCSLNFNISGLGFPAPIIKYRVDGLNWVDFQLNSASVNVVMPSATMAYPNHLLEIIVRSTSETLNRWNAEQTAIKFTSITIDDGATVTKPDDNDSVVYLLGDSITEGVRTLNATEANDVDRNDATQSYVYDLDKYIGCSVSNVGFGRQGWNVTGNGDVPILGSSWKYVYNGAARAFPANLKAIIANMGTNDGGADVTAQIVSFLNDAINTVSCKIILICPFNQSQSANLKNAIAQCNNPSRVSYIDTASLSSLVYANSSDTLHPNGSVNLSKVAPFLGKAIKPFVSGSGFSNVAY